MGLANPKGLSIHKRFQQGNLTSYGTNELTVDMGLAIFKILTWDLPFSKCLETGLKYAVMGSGKSHGTCPFSYLKMASPMGLAIFSF